MEGVVNKFGRTVARHQTQRGKVECQIKFSFYRGRKIVTRELNVSRWTKDERKRIICRKRTMKLTMELDLL